MNASLNEKLGAVKWGEFKLVDVFTVKNTSNILAYNIIEGSGTVPYLCASSENNAVSTYIDYDKKYLEKGNCIFIGGKTFVVTYQEEDFYSNDSHNLALYLKEGTKSKNVFLYTASCIYKSLCSKYSWGNSISRAKIQDDVVTFPITDNGVIDFDFMESFIAELEAERVAELSAYLTVSGLDNYELSSEEEKALKNYQFLKWDTYNLEKLFGKSTRGKRLKGDDRIAGTLPFVTAGEASEGISAYISNEIEVFEKNTQRLICSALRNIEIIFTAVMIISQSYIRRICRNTHRYLLQQQFTNLPIMGNSITAIISMQRMQMHFTYLCR